MSKLEKMSLKYILKNATLKELKCWLSGMENDHKEINSNERIRLIREEIDRRKMEDKQYESEY